MSEHPTNDLIFEEALRKPTPDEREAYLREVCRGDDRLRQRLTRMIDARLVAGEFLETPVKGARLMADLISDPELAIPPESVSDLSFELPPGLLAPSDRADSLGRLGGLEVLEIIARGGMGIVLRGFDEKLHRDVAIKVLPPEVSADAATRRRFVREARRAASVVHDNVIAIFAVDDSGTLPYIVMPLIDGRSLQEKIRLEGALKVEAALQIAIQIAEGLAAVHARDLVHRDLKPANILIENQGERVRITDFGVARAIDDPHATQYGLIAGTPAYMSPEQAGGLPVDHRADLFALGSLIFAMVTGRPPFEGESVVGVIRQVCDHSPPSLREANPGVPEALSDLVAKLHARSPEDRPQSAAEVAALLRAQLVRSEPEAPTSPKSFDLRRKPRFGQRLSFAAAICSFVLLALGATEATGVTDFRGTVVRLLIPEGTLVVEVDDPNVSVNLEGTDLVITGAGAQEIRLKPGSYQLKASRDGKVLKQELVNIVRDGRQIVRVSSELTPQLDDTSEWEKVVAGLPPEAQVEAVKKRLQELNPGFEGKMEWAIKDGFVHRIKIDSEVLSDISPLRTFRKLSELHLQGPFPGRGKVMDLRPLRGLPLKSLHLISQQISDLEPLRGMPLEALIMPESRVADLAPLQGMKLKAIALQNSSVASLEPLRGMPLEMAELYKTPVKDLSPLKGMPIIYLNIGRLNLSDADLKIVSELKQLKWLYMLGAPIRDISPLRSLRLEKIDLRGTRVEDLSPLLGMPLIDLRLDYRPDRADFLRSFPKLTEINHKPAKAFWAEVEKAK